MPDQYCSNTASLHDDWGVSAIALWIGQEGSEAAKNPGIPTVARALDQLFIPGLGGRHVSRT